MTTTTCSGHLGVLRCSREPGHPHGHVYLSGAGSDVPDRHDATSGGEH